MGIVDRVVCLPGFGDPLVGARWVAELSARVGDGVDVVAIDWPGLWTRWIEPVSFRRLVDDTAALCDERTVLVGHSLGGRVALQLACEGLPLAGVVSLCSPAHVSIFAPDAAAAWREQGGRVTHRTSLGGADVTFDLPVVFLDEALAWLEDAAVPLRRHLMIFGGADDLGGAEPWHRLADAGGPQPRTLTLPGCPHMFMDAQRDRDAAIAAVAAFVSAS